MAFLSPKDYRKLDITVLAFSPLIAGIICNAFNLNFFISTIFFLGLPSLYLSWRTKKAVIRALVFSSLFLVPTIIIDHYASLDKSWFVPHTIFPFRLLGTVPLEDMEAGFLAVYICIIFYEHFFDKGKHKILESYARFAPYLAIGTLSAFLYLFLNSGVVKIDYLYFKFGVIFILIPTAAFILKFPKYISIFLKTAPYFFYLALLEELTALRLGHWAFPGKHLVGWISVLSYRFPVEELLFFITIFSISIISYFEFFDDAKLRSKR